MKTFKKVILLALCAAMLLSLCVFFSGCAEKLTKENPGAIIPLYVSRITSFDPMMTYSDDASAKLISLTGEGLFSVSSSGSLEKELCKSYSINKDEHKIVIKLRSTMWSDGTTVDADDFVYAWTRVLDPESECDAAALLFGIKNAVKVKNGDLTSSSLGVIAAESNKIEIEYEEWADPDQLLYNFASTALYPVREDVSKKINDENWGSLAAILVSNGPFYVKKIDIYSNVPNIVLERNTYYYLNPEKNESLGKYVLPYRLELYITDGKDETVDFVQNIFNGMKLENPNLVNERRAELQKTLPEEELAKYNNNQLTALAEELIKKDIRENNALDYIEKIKDKLVSGKLAYFEKYKADDKSILFNASLSEEAVSELADRVETEDMLMTGAFYFNLENEIFASKEVRQALSSVLDRTEVAKLAVNAKPAEGLISYKVFNTSKKTSFREAGGNLIKTSDVSAAAKVIENAGLSGKSFTITASNDERDIAIAEYAKSQWEKLGFKVDIAIAGYVKYDYTEPALKKNKDGVKEWVDEILYEGLTKDLYKETYEKGEFDVILRDVNMLSTDAFTALAPYCAKYSGGAYDFSDEAVLDPAEGEDPYAPIKHKTGYSSEEYDKLIEAALVETDKEKRAELLHDAEKLLMEDMPVVPLFYYTSEYSVSDEISGIETDYFGSFNFNDVKYPGYKQAVETVAEEAEVTEVAE